jgi:hypothetical protein
MQPVETVVVDIVDYRREPLRYERMASEERRIVVKHPDGRVYSIIGGPSVLPPPRQRP